MKRKTKRFDEGGETIDMRENTSQPTGIDEDVRSRAMKYIQSGKKDEETAKPAPKAVAKPAPKAETKSEDKENPEMVKKAYADAAKMSAKNKEASEGKVNGKSFSETVKDKQAELDKNKPKAEEPKKSLGKRIREALGSKYKSGGSVKSSASKRGDGIAQRGKTRGTMVMCGGGMAKGKKK